MTGREVVQEHAAAGRPRAQRLSGQYLPRMLAVLALALALRVLVVVSWAKHFGATSLYTRGFEMGWLGKSLVEGQGLSSPFGVPTGPTAFFAPAYPVLVAGIFQAFGVYSRASACVILGLQIGLNVLTVWLLMMLGRRLFGERAGMLAGIFWAVSPPLLYLPTVFWETSLSICLLTGLIAAALWVRQLPSLTRWTGFGAYGGLIALVNPALLLTLIAVAAGTAVVCFLRRELAWPHAAAGLLTFALVFCAWPIRNARVFHAFIPLRTTVGFELWMGNHAGSTGFLDESLYPSNNKAELAAYEAQGEVAYTGRKSTLAERYIAGHPRAFLALSARRFARFWLGAGRQDGSPLFIAHATVTTVLGLLGLGLLFRRRRWSVAWLLATPLLFFPLPYYVTHAEFRFRLVIDALLTLLASYAVAGDERPDEAVRSATEAARSRRGSPPGP